MFTTHEIRTGRGILQYRRESLTGIRCRISPIRVDRQIDAAPALPSSRDGCPFCPDAIESSTPTFQDGSRLRCGESVTFPNLYPFAACHVVTVITPDHTAGRFDRRCLADAISGTADERCSERLLFEDEIFWSATPVPLGEREVRGVLPVSTLAEFGPYVEPLADGILRIIAFYRSLGTHAFNASIFFDAPKTAGRGHRVFCSLIARLNPNRLSMCDSAFMERLHLEPVILTLPESLGALFREKG
ncbi:MAG: Galactose-1-phosphate uridylyltransferase-like protein [Methanoculleus marisnigri]|uniref:Galactose-1-phosphate uridylyltransferase-like protein n=1 Tax=Methanoculleus marisnigri TaxID=2198 RepID=A0A124FSS9_9EURY|nr:MAG: Galactose-1-phosphate uridylyltransferase-like protein [Methanoculleus marisnigri]